MILCTLENLLQSQYPWLRPQVSAWLRTLTADIAEGRHELGGDYANVETPTLRMCHEALLEAHRRYIDIHIPLDSAETIGWAPTEALGGITGQGYDAGRDITFYTDAPHTYIDVRPGQCAVFFPEDAHAPNIGEPAPHRKICVKIAVKDAD